MLIRRTGTEIHMYDLRPAPVCLSIGMPQQCKIYTGTLARVPGIYDISNEPNISIGRVGRIYNPHL